MGTSLNGGGKKIKRRTCARPKRAGGITWRLRVRTGNSRLPVLRSLSILHPILPEIVQVLAVGHDGGPTAYHGRIRQSQGPIRFIGTATWGRSLRRRPGAQQLAGRRRSHRRAQFVAVCSRHPHRRLGTRA